MRNITRESFFEKEQQVLRAVYQSANTLKRVYAGLYYIRLGNALYEILRINAAVGGYWWTYRQYGRSSSHDVFLTRQGALDSLRMSHALRPRKTHK